MPDYHWSFYNIAFLYFNIIRTKTSGILEIELFEANSQMTISCSNLADATCMRILKFLRCSNCFGVRIDQKISPNHQVSFIKAQNLTVYTNFNARFNLLFAHLLFYAFYKVSLYDCPVFPKDIHCLQLHLAEESKNRLKFRAHHIKKWNLDDQELHLLFLGVLILPWTVRRWDFEWIILLQLHILSLNKWFFWILSFFNVTHVLFYWLHGVWVLLIFRFRRLSFQRRNWRYLQIFWSISRDHAGDFLYRTQSLFKGLFKSLLSDFEFRESLCCTVGMR